MRDQRLLIVGLGSIGERHLRCAQRLGCTTVIACETNPVLRNKIAERYGINEIYESLTAAMTVRPTAAVICVPAPLHVPMATQLASAGMHVLIEKPLATSLDGVDALTRTVEAKNVVAAVAYVLRANPILAGMREAIRSGRFGKPVQLVCVTGQHFPFYRPAYRDTYYRDRATGGGAVQDALTHMINAGEWLIGSVDRVLADAAHQVLPGVEVEDTVHVIARQQGIPASYSLNQHQAPDESNLTVVCQQGTVRCEMHKNRWRWMTEPGSTWHDELGPPQERDDLFVSQLAAFFAAIDERQSPLCTLQEGIQSLRVNLAILRSLESTAWMSIA